MDINSNKNIPATHTSEHHGGRYQFLSKVKDFAEGFVGLKFNNNHD
jgi:hypothetical protein